MRVRLSTAELLRSKSYIIETKTVIFKTCWECGMVQERETDHKLDGWTASSVGQHSYSLNYNDQAYLLVTNDMPEYCKKNYSLLYFFLNVNVNYVLIYLNRFYT